MKLGLKRKIPMWIKQDANRTYGFGDIRYSGFYAYVIGYVSDEFEAYHLLVDSDLDFYYEGWTDDELRKLRLEVKEKYEAFIKRRRIDLLKNLNIFSKINETMFVNYLISSVLEEKGDELNRVICEEVLDNGNIESDNFELKVFNIIIHTSAYKVSYAPTKIAIKAACKLSNKLLDNVNL